MKNAIITVSIIAIILITAKISISLSNYHHAMENRMCIGFGTRIKAQNAFDKDPVKWSALDRDKDGLACESLPKS